MYLNIRALEIADGLKDALIHADSTIESILEYGPGEIASTLPSHQILVTCYRKPSTAANLY